MKILIVGDLSNAGYFLKSGFEKLGVKTNHLSFQHLWMERKIEFNLSSVRGGLIGSLENYLNLRKVFGFKGYDAVIFVDYFPFPRRWKISNFLSRYLADNNVKTYLWLLGCDSHQYKWSSINQGDMCNRCIKFDNDCNECPQANNRHEENEFLKNITKIVPGSYEYLSSRPVEQHHKISKPIQMCIDLDEIKFFSPSKGKSVNFFHGLNRIGMKGTALVEEAFLTMKPSYPDVNFIIKGQLGYGDYLNFLQQMNITLDQVFNRSLGINSLMNMAMGKLVTLGNVEQGCKAMGIPPPRAVSQIQTPDLVGVLNASAKAIQKYNSDPLAPEEARSYVETYHSSVFVANRFLNEVL